MSPRRISLRRSTKSGVEVSPVSRWMWETRTAVLLAEHLGKGDGVLNALLPGLTLEREEWFLAALGDRRKLEEITIDDKLRHD